MQALRLTYPRFLRQTRQETHKFLGIFIINYCIMEIEGFAVTKCLTNLSKMMPFLLSVLSRIRNGMKTIAKQAKVDMIWVAGRNLTLVSHSLRGVAMNLKATTLTYLAISYYYRMRSGKSSLFWQYSTESRRLFSY